MSIKNLESVIASNNSIIRRIDAFRIELLEEMEEKLIDTGLCGRITYLKETWWDAKPGTVLEYSGLYINENDQVDAVYEDPDGNEVIRSLGDLLQHAAEGKVKIA